MNEIDGEYALPLVSAERGYSSFDQEASGCWNADFLYMFLKVVSEFPLCICHVYAVFMLKQMPKLQIIVLECYDFLAILKGKTF